MNNNPRRWFHVLVLPLLLGVLAGCSSPVGSSKPEFAQFDDDAAARNIIGLGRIGALTGTTSIAKEGDLLAPWVDEYYGSTKIGLSCNRIGVISNGNLYVKEGNLTASWVLVANAVQDFKMVNDRIGVLLTNGDFIAKQGTLTASWVTMAHGVSKIDLSATRVGVLYPNGDFMAKEGSLEAAWVHVYIGAADIALTDTRLGVIDHQDNFFVKEGGLTAYWVSMMSDVGTMALFGDRIGAVQKSNNNFYCKEGALDAAWIFQTGDTKEIALSADRIGALYFNGNFIVKEGGLESGWSLVCTGATQIALTSLASSFELATRKDLDTITATAIAELGTGIKVDISYGPRTGKTIVDFGTTKTVRYMLNIYNTINGSYAGCLFSYNYNGLKWGFLRGNRISESTARLLIETCNQYGQPINFENLVNKQVGLGKAYKFNGAVSIIQKNNGQIIYVPGDNLVCENEALVSASSTKQMKIHTVDCNGQSYYSEGYELSYGGITEKFTEITVCFKAGTPVSTDKGLVNIENIRQGDMVLSVNAATGERGYKKVLQTSKKSGENLVELEIDGEKIFVTAEHPFMVTDGSWPWIAASQLNVGQKLQTGTDGKYSTVTGKKFTSQKGEVYNLSVEDWETYTVGASASVVHNRCWMDNFVSVGQTLSLEFYAGPGGSLTLEYLGNGLMKVKEAGVGFGIGAALNYGPVILDLSMKTKLVVTMDPHMPLALAGDVGANFMNLLSAGFKFKGAANIHTSDFDVGVGSSFNFFSVGRWYDFNSKTDPRTGRIIESSTNGYGIEVPLFQWQEGQGFTLNLKEWGGLFK